VEAFAGEVVEAEAELGLFDLVFEFAFRAVPALERVGGAFLVVGDDRPVVPFAAFEGELLAGLGRVAADDEAPLLFPGGRPPAGSSTTSLSSR